MNFELLGDRVLILLNKASDHSITDSGLTVPLFVNEESDGGRPISRVASIDYLPAGKVIKMSPKAKELIPVREGDSVYVPYNAVSPSYQFFPSRTKLVQDFEGYIVVPASFIEAKIN